ncbi:hypothetical protein BJ508DRAFT_323552 [Ascobolus immersus RN42]|uniref:F-box domain-containing protein n=1 Tax=Ascobolus immersus RN42 TaxID=1160509 RepID=A0A3N4IEV5_ASCIM|nr:hypothetical protein BJ508DRAFT_323552 [Ascobolus immersus RN42]
MKRSLEPLQRTAAKRKCLSAGLSIVSILKLPNEMLAEIMTQIDDHQTYLALYSTCKRFHAIAADPINRRRFAKNWFAVKSTRYEELESASPGLIEYTARYIRRHCKQPELKSCRTKFVRAELRKYKIPQADARVVIGLFGSSWMLHTLLWFDADARRQILRLGWDEEREHAGLEKKDMDVVLRMIERMCGQPDAIDPRAGGRWTVETVVLDMEDVLVASVLFEVIGRGLTRIPWEMLRSPRKESELTAEARVWLFGIADMRDRLVCMCGREFEEE